MVNTWYIKINSVDIKRNKMSRFSITNGKGFNLTFANKWQISVQWGPGNYCERENEDFDAPKKQNYWVSGSAEVAVWK